MMPPQRPCVKLPVRRDRLFPNTIRDADGVVLFSLQFVGGTKSPAEIALEDQLARVIVERLNAAPFPEMDTSHD